MVVRAWFWLSLLLVSGFSFAEDFNFKDFDDYQGTLNRANALQKIEKLLQKSADITDNYGISDDGKELRLYASLEDKKAGKVEYAIQFGEKAIPASKEKKSIGTSTMPLRDLKIAIDPGHLGGEMAHTEERYIDMKPFEGSGDKKIQFNEGTLTVLTARHLKKLLEDAGATVMLTKDKPGQPVAEMSFAQWHASSAFPKTVEMKVSIITDPAKQEEARQWWLNTAKPNDIFRGLYNPLDLRARVAKINQFEPDLALAIHYNAGAGNDKMTGQNLGTKENINMIFVPGSFMKGELSTQEARYNFLRLLVTDDLERSILLADELGKQFENHLKVPLAADNQTVPTDYLTKSCMPSGKKGVFCRNLPLVRQPKCTVVYGETFYQDNFEECQKLAETTFEVDGYKTSPRVGEVAQSYFEAILKVYGPN